MYSCKVTFVCVNFNCVPFSIQFAWTVNGDDLAAEPDIVTADPGVKESTLSMAVMDTYLFIEQVFTLYKYVCLFGD